MVIFVVHVIVLHVVEGEQVIEEQEVVVLFLFSLEEFFVSLGWIIADPLEQGLKVEPAVESFVLVFDSDHRLEVILGQIL